MFFILIFGLLYSSSSKSFVRSYEYKASDYDSKVSARTASLKQVKLLLLEEVGVYMTRSFEHTKTEVNGEFTETAQENVKIYTAGVTETKVLEEKWNGETYFIKAEIVLDSAKLAQNVENLSKNDEEKALLKKKLKEKNKSIEASEAEIRRLRYELEKERSASKQRELQQSLSQKYKELDQKESVSILDWQIAKELKQLTDDAETLVKKIFF